MSEAGAKPGFFRCLPGSNPDAEAGILRAATARSCTKPSDTRYACQRTLTPPRLAGVRKSPAFGCCSTTPQPTLPIAVLITTRAAGPKCRALPEARLFPRRARSEPTRKKPGFFAATAGSCTKPSDTRYACLKTLPPPRLAGVQKIPAFGCCSTTPQPTLPIAVLITTRAAGPKCRALRSPAFSVACPL